MRDRQQSSRQTEQEQRRVRPLVTRAVCRPRYPYRPDYCTAALALRCDIG
jgi:hypothetical protein